MALLVGAIFIPSVQSLAQEANSVTDIIPFPTTAKTLGNGLEVIVMPMPSNGVVAFWSIVRTGSRDEYEPGRSGFAHFFEHMMFRGTERYPPARYLEVTTRIGADANAYTTDDHTAYHLSLSKEDFESVLEIESDRFQNLAYSEAAFQTEAGAVYGEYRKSRTDPEFALEESLMATAFEKHTYGHTTMGFERDIAAMPKMYDYSQLLGHTTDPNTVLFVSGDVRRACCRSWSVLRRLEARLCCAEIPSSRATAERRVTCVRRPDTAVCDRVQSAAFAPPTARARRTSSRICVRRDERHYSGSCSSR
jgi:zinc protease